MGLMNGAQAWPLTTIGSLEGGVAVPAASSGSSIAGASIRASGRRRILMVLAAA
jgi:hypothetical protein